MQILDYFDRLAIVHLTEMIVLRPLTRELSKTGIDINRPKVTIPGATMPETSNGFHSRGVYASYLSHLETFRAIHVCQTLELSRVPTS
jgi:hypothetical protein